LDDETARSPCTWTRDAGTLPNAKTGHSALLKFAASRRQRKSLHVFQLRYAKPRPQKMLATSNSLLACQKGQPQIRSQANGTIMIWATRKLKSANDFSMVWDSKNHLSNTALPVQSTPDMLARGTGQNGICGKLLHPAFQELCVQIAGSSQFCDLARLLHISFGGMQTGLRRAGEEMQISVMAFRRR
jgi:hypothetical protein